MLNRGLVAAGIGFLPLAALAGVARLQRGSPSEFQVLFALATWLLTGAVMLAAGWFARDAGVPVGRGDVRSFRAGLLVLGAMPFLSAPGFMGLLAWRGVEDYNMGHNLWLSLQGAGIALLGLAAVRPELPALQRPGRLAALVAGGLVVLVVAAAPWIPPVLRGGFATPLYDGVLLVLALGAFAASAPLWAVWLRRGGAGSFMAGAALTLLGYAMLGFLLQQNETEAATGWFGRFSALGAAFLMVWATVLPAAQPLEVSAAEPAPPPLEALRPKA